MVAQLRNVLRAVGAFLLSIAVIVLIDFTMQVLCIHCSSRDQSALRNVTTFVAQVNNPEKTDSLQTSKMLLAMQRHAAYVQETNHYLPTANYQRSLAAQPVAARSPPVFQAKAVRKSQAPYVRADAALFHSLYYTQDPALMMTTKPRRRSRQPKNRPRKHPPNQSRRRRRRRRRRLRPRIRRSTHPSIRRSTGNIRRRTGSTRACRASASRRAAPRRSSVLPRWRATSKRPMGSTTRWSGCRLAACRSRAWCAACAAAARPRPSRTRTSSTPTPSSARRPCASNSTRPVVGFN